jgi:hypothetical protein
MDSESLGRVLCETGAQPQKVRFSRRRRKERRATCKVIS